MRAWKRRVARCPVLLLTSASPTSSTWSAADSLTSMTGWKWVYLMFDNILNSCRSCVGFIKLGGSIDHCKKWTRSWRVCFQAYATVVTSAEGADVDSLGRVDEIKQYPSSAFLRLNGGGNPLERQGVPQLLLQCTVHPGRLRTRVSGLRQVHKAENRPCGPTHLGRLLTVQIHPAMAALWSPLIKYVLRSFLMSTADKKRQICIDRFPGRKQATTHQLRFLFFWAISTFVLKWNKN